MPLDPISCNQCGAQLRIPPDAQFVTCNHCRTQLAVRRNESVRYTEALAQIDQRTQQLSQQVAHLSYESALARLDREWEREKETYLVNHKDGRRTEPSAFGSIFGGAFACVMGTIFVVAAPGPMPIFGLFFIVFGVVIAIVGFNGAHNFEAARRRYQTARANLSPDQFLTTDPVSSSRSPAKEKAVESFLTDLSRNQSDPA